jgi:hypothetical protein
MNTDNLATVYRIQGTASEPGKKSYSKNINKKIKDSPSACLTRNTSKS